MTQSQQAISPELYEDIEKTCMPIIRRAARRFAPGLGIDVKEAIQEGRLALFLGMQEYDYNQSKGGIYNFARAIVGNAMCGLLYAATTQSRCPRVVVEENGEMKLVKVRPLLVENHDLIEDQTSKSPEDLAIELEFREKTRIWYMRLVNSLNLFQRQVLACISHTDVNFDTFLRNKGKTEATSALIGEYLGMGSGKDRQNQKNSVDWAIHKIKGRFALLMESEFSDIFKEALKAKKWPMLYVSTKWGDNEFIQQIIQTRDLDPRPTAAPDVKVRTKGNERSARHIETYPWGAVIMLRHAGQEATVVAEGRFNPISGEVLQGSGFWKSITEVVPWYPKARLFIEGKT